MIKIKHVRYHDYTADDIQEDVNNYLEALQRAGNIIKNVTATQSVYFAGNNRHDNVIYTIMYDNTESV